MILLRIMIVLLGAFSVVDGCTKGADAAAYGLLGFVAAAIAVSAAASIIRGN